MKNKLLILAIIASMLPVLIGGAVISSLLSVFGKTDDDDAAEVASDEGTVDSLIDICVNHAEIPKKYKTSEYAWVKSCRDDIYDMRTEAFQSEGTINAEGSAKDCADYLSGMKLNNAQVAAILGCWQQESSFDPTAVNQSGGAYGIAQWRFGRFDALKQYANQQAGNDNADNWKNLDYQLGYFKQEYDAGSGWVVPEEKEKFEKATTVDEATKAFLCGYEGGYGYENTLNSDGEVKSAYGVSYDQAMKDYEKRLSNAKSFLSSSSSSSGSNDTRREALASTILFAYALSESDEDTHYNARYVTGLFKDWNKYADCITDTDYTKESYTVKKDETWDNLTKAGFKDPYKVGGMGDDDAGNFPDIAVAYATELMQNGSMTGVGADAASVSSIKELSQFGEDYFKYYGQGAEKIWATIDQASNGGKNFTVYNGPDRHQCTDVSHWLFWLTYKTDWSGAGNGSECVDRIVSSFSASKKTPNGYYFVKSNKPAAGAVYSVPGTAKNPNGHTGYINKVEGQYMWYTDGNISNIKGKPGEKGIRVMNKIEISKVNWTYAIPQK